MIIRAARMGLCIALLSLVSQLAAQDGEFNALPTPQLNDERPLSTAIPRYSKQPLWAERIAIRQQISREEVRVTGYHSMRPNAAAQTIYSYSGYRRPMYYFYPGYSYHFPMFAY